MNLQQLETFMWIARLRSFSLAARKVNATQSTVSTRLADLEKELGVKLCDRTRKSVRITPKGRDMLRYADEMLKLASEVRQHVGNRHAVTGTVRIGAAELIALTWLPQLIKSIQASYPLVAVEMRIGVGGDLMEHMKKGSLDLAFVPLGPDSAAGLQSLNLGEVKFDFLAAPESGISRTRHTPRQITEWPIITHGASSVIDTVIQKWFAAGGVKIEERTVSNSMEAAAALAKAGLGATFLPLPYYEQAIRAGELMRVSCSPSIPPVKFAAIWLPGTSSSLVDALVKLAAGCTSFKKRQGGRIAHQV